jgi:hypothetical protein
MWALSTTLGPKSSSSSLKNGLEKRKIAASSYSSYTFIVTDSGFNHYGFWPCMSLNDEP